MSCPLHKKYVMNDSHAAGAVAPPSRELILSTQLIFNIGFYAVVPFLAVHMADDLAMSSRAIGLVLGVRTFCQQGLFFVGGWLAGLFGSRRLMLAGCAVRIAGYVSFAFAGSAWEMTLGACLTGMGGAMFSPCLEALAAEVEQQTPAQGRKRSIFALFAICGELGAVVGPLLGSMLIGIGFKAMALTCAALFLVALLRLRRRMPIRTAAPTKSEGWRGVARNKEFLRFIFFYSAYLLSYNQLYFSLSAEVRRVGGGSRETAGLFMLASMLVVALQMPIAALCRRWPYRRSLALGFSLFAAAFMCVALASAFPMPESWLRFAPVTAMVILLSLGQMFAVPVAMSLVPAYARQSLLPMHYGALASAGGCAVLVGNFLIGQLFDLAGGGHDFYYPLAWSAAAFFPAVSAVYFASRLWRSL